MSEPGKVQCPSCPAWFVPVELRAHLSSTHLFYHPFRCAHCGHYFLSKDKLRLHANLNNCLPVQVVEDPQEEKETELQALIKQATSEPLAENVPTPPPFSSPCSVPKNSSSASSTPITTPSRSIDTPTGRPSGRQFKFEHCSICQDAISANVKSLHVKSHVKRIKAGKEASPLPGLGSHLLYEQIRSVCFPNTIWDRDRGVKRGLEDSPRSNDEEDDGDQPEVDEHRGKDGYSQCQKCSKWVYRAQKARHCKNHTRELLQEKGESSNNNDELQRLFLAKREHWFPNTIWKPEIPSLVINRSASAGLACQPQTPSLINDSASDDRLSKSPAAPPKKRAEVASRCVICEVEVVDRRYHVLRRHLNRAPIQCPHGDFEDFLLGVSHRAKEHMEKVHNEPKENLLDFRADMKPDMQLWLAKCFPDHKLRFPEKENLGAREKAKTESDLQLTSVMAEPREKNLFDFFQKEAPKSTDAPTKTQTCKMCREEVVEWCRLSHVWREHCDGRVPFGCSVCGFSAVEWDACQRHVSAVHPMVAAHVSSDEDASRMFSERERLCFSN